MEKGWYKEVSPEEGRGQEAGASRTPVARSCDTDSGQMAGTAGLPRRSLGCLDNSNSRANGGTGALPQCSQSLVTVDVCWLLPTYSSCGGPITPVRKNGILGSFAVA